MLNQCSNTGFSQGGRTFLGTMPVSWDDASLFALRGVLNQIQGDREVVIAYAS